MVFLFVMNVYRINCQYDLPYRSRDIQCSADLPNVLHYGLLYGIEEKGWEFDKHWYQEFDALKCPPWEAPGPDERPTQGLFPFPPRPSSLTSRVSKPKAALFHCNAMTSPDMLARTLDSERKCPCKA